MRIPTTPTPGFDFDEAIGLAELSQRAHQISQHNSGEPVERYNLLFKADEWRCVQAFRTRQPPLQMLLLKRQTAQQLALLFTPAPAVSPGQAAPAPAAAGQPIAVTNLPAANPAQLASKLTADSTSVEYWPEADPSTPLLHGARIYQRWQQTFALLQSELERWLARAAQSEQFDLTQGYSLYVVGHGVGGCLAVLAALHLKRLWEAQLDCPAFQLKVYTFGAPRMGNQAFVEYYQQQMQGFSYGVQNPLDRTIYEPLLPLAFPFDLPTLVPGIDYVRRGTQYFTVYAHVGETVVLPGVRLPVPSLELPKSLRPVWPLPFAHDPAGYQALLQQAQRQQRVCQQATQSLRGWLRGQQQQVEATLQKQAADWQRRLNRWQGSGSS